MYVRMSICNLRFLTIFRQIFSYQNKRHQFDKNYNHVNFRDDLSQDEFNKILNEYKSELGIDDSGTIYSDYSGYGPRGLFKFYVKISCLSRNI